MKLSCVGLFCAGPVDASSSRSSSQEIDNDETTHAACSSTAQSGGGSGGAAAAVVDSLAPLRRRRASMQDALDFTKINASLYERPVSYFNLFNYIILSVASIDEQA